MKVPIGRRRLRGGETTGIVKRIFAAACLLLAATACGAETSVSVAQPGTLPVKEWCAEYRQIFVDSGFPFPDAGGGAFPVGTPSPPEATVFVSMMGKLEALADSAPVEIRDELKALWTVPPGALTSPPSIPSIPFPSIPDDAGERLAQRLEHPMRWISDHCGPEMPPGPPSGPPSGEDLPPLDIPRPVGDWQAVQRGSVGNSRWTFFRIEASNGGACVSFEADPSYIDGQARIQAQAPPGISVPPIPPPSVPDVPGLSYKGKLPQCGPKPDLFGRSDPVVFWVQDEDETNRYNVLAGLVVDSVRSLTITFREGGQKVVKPVDGSFVATYDAKLHVAKVVPDLGPGAQVSCAPLPPGGGPPGVPDYLALACNGSYNPAVIPPPRG